MEAPRRRLPGWNRPSLGVSGTLHRDRETPLPPAKFGAMSRGSGGSRRRQRRIEEEVQAARELDRKIAFVRQQHVETLQQLQEESEKLKRENRALTFKLVMCRCGYGHSDSNSTCRAKQSSSHINTPTEELQVLFLQEEAGRLRQALASERDKNIKLLNLLQHRLSREEGAVSVAGGGGGGGGGHSLLDYENTIKHLQHEKERKDHEIKSDLKDVLYSDKWTPNAYLLARAYVSQDEEERGEERGTEERGGREERGETRVRLPGVSTHKLVVRLPALRPHLTTGVAEKHRRRRAVRETGKLRHNTLHSHNHLPPMDRPL